jgi:hypothetical protein
MTATVKLANGSDYTLSKLLADGDSNAKLTKSNQSGKGYLTFGLSLSPANTSGYQTCASSSAGCRAACLNTAGMGRFSTTQNARIAKTRLFFEQRNTFLYMLETELAKASRKATKEGKHCAVRLNVVSDVMWEQFGIMEMFPEIQFYDYTKHAKRMIKYCEGGLPSNYHLTFSRSECNHNECLQVINAGGNVTVVFNSKELPTHWYTRPVIDGDETDLRFLDDKNVIVGLYHKGDGKKDKTGFVVNLL